MESKIRSARSGSGSESSCSKCFGQKSKKFAVKPQIQFWLLWEQRHFSRLRREAAARFNVEFGEDVHNIANLLCSDGDCQ